MPTEIDEGKAKLTDLQTASEFEVEYKLTFITNLEIIRRRFPPVLKQKQSVQYIRRIDGKAIDEGEYLLERDAEINRVKNFGFENWHVLSWPIG